MANLTIYEKLNLLQVLDWLRVVDVFSRMNSTQTKSAKTDRNDTVVNLLECENGVNSQESVAKHGQNTFTQRELRDMINEIERT